MFKSNKGVTLIVLVVTVVILLIIISVGTYSGVTTLEGSKIMTFSMELKMLQEQVDVLNIKAKKDNTLYNLGTAVSDISDETLKNKLESILNENGITDAQGYRYFTQKQILDLGVEGIEQEAILNINTKEVISVTGFIKDGVTYRTLKQMSDANLIDSTYQVTNTVSEKTNQIDFDCVYSSAGNDIYNIDVSNITCSGNVKKIKISYSYNSNTFKSVAENYTFDSYTFQVQNEGSYIIKVEDISGNYKIKEIVVAK